LAQPVYALTVAINRDIAAGIAKAAAAHNAHVCGLFICHTCQGREKDLELAMEILNPRPGICIVGGGLGDEDAAIVERTYEAFCARTETKGLFVRVTPGTLEKYGRAGVFNYVMEELEKKFG